MARIRTIKPEFFRHELLQHLQGEHPELNPMLVFAGLWTCCDKEGRFEWKPRHLKLDVLPFLSFDMAKSLEALKEAGLIEQYEVGGKLYGFVPTFKDHQRITGKEAQAPAKHPKPTGDTRGNTREAPENTRETPGNAPGAQEREWRKGMEEGNGEADCAVAPVALPTPPPMPNPTHAVPDSVDNRILCERLGIFKMRDQAEVQKLYEVYCRGKGKSATAGMEHIVSRWVEYSEVAPQLEWQWGSAYAFLMSGKWDDPRSWPRGKMGRLEESYREILGEGA